MCAVTDILPVVIDCQPQILGNHQPWYYLPPSKAKFSLHILPPVSLAPVLAGQDTQRGARYAVNDYLLSVLEASAA